MTDTDPAQGLELDELNAWNRKGALEEIDSLKLLRATSWEQHSHSFKWLTASLLALNGGGLLSIASLKIPFDDKLIAGSSFTIGLAFALLVAVLSQRAIIAMLVPIQRQIGYWMTVVDDGVRDESFEATLNKETKSSVRLAIVGQAAGWLSALALFGGIVAAGSGLAQVSDHSQITPIAQQAND